MLLHRFLVLAQDLLARGVPSQVAPNQIHEYVDLPRPEAAAKQVRTKQFLDQLIELRQNFMAVRFGHNGLSFDLSPRPYFPYVT
jgi:hypothetical protein